MVTDFVLGLGGRRYGIRASAPSRFCVVPLRGQDEASGAAVIRLEPHGQSTMVSGEVDYTAAEKLLSDAAFWSGRPAADAARLAEVAVRIRDELASGRPGSRALAGAWAVELLILVTRLGEHAATARRPWKAPDGIWSIADAIRYIELNYDEAFSLEWFVSKCAVNTSDFSRRFKERAGCPLFEFINRQRIERACALLKSSGLSIIEISEAVGYNNLSFFNRYFLRIVGLSPREYRSSAR